MANISSVISYVLGLLLLAAFRCDAAFTPPYDPSQFANIGYITGMTSNPSVRSTGTDKILRGGTISLDGVSITVPDNTLVTLPSITVAWSELFTSSNAPNLPGFGSISWQATVYGNMVSGQPIAGLIYLSQESSLNAMQGFIEEINSDGTFVVGGQKCVLNDPTGKFSPGYTGGPLWTIDPDNPSVKADTGYPLCIPRSSNDALCPAKNRKDASGAFSSQFTFPAPPTDDTTPTGPNTPDARLPAPLRVGDYVTYSATNIGGLHAVYALTANLGLRTAPGSQPAYITAESVNWGVVDPNAPANIETGETRAVVFTTDASQAIEWSAQDVDPCTGETSLRSILTGTPSTTIPIGKVVYRNGKTPFNTPPRQVIFRASKGVRVLANGLRAGEFVQPLFDYIFPELTNPGDQMFPNNFNVFDYLGLGGGPYSGGVPNAGLTEPFPIVGQLNPWPGKTAPAKTACPPPSADPPTTGTTPPPPTTANPPVDKITITSVTTKKNNGRFTVTVTATTDLKTIPKGENFSLFLSTVGTVPDTGPTTMTLTSTSGTWTITQQFKKQPTSIIVTSSRGGKATQP